MKKKHNTGFTLIELMVVVAVLAIFAGLAIPSFSTMITANRVKSTADEFHALLASARADAVTQRSAISVTKSGDLWSTGKHQLTIPAGVSVTPSKTTITFSADGTATESSTTVSSTDNSTSYTIETKLVGFIKKS